MDHPKYSIVLPAFNESARITSTLKQILAHASDQHWDVEVVVVDDGSTDDTATIVETFAQNHHCLRLIQNPGNRGKGFSVRNGMLHANGEVLLFSDADLSSPIGEADKLFAAITVGADIAIGSRWVRTELQVRRQPLYRQVLGRIFNLALRVVLRLNYKDTQCGFKAFTRQAAHEVFPHQQIERWGFDPELLYLARKHHLKVAEVPVAWAHREGTRIHPICDGLRMFGDVLRVRRNAMQGKYTRGKVAPAITPE